VQKSWTRRTLIQSGWGCGLLLTELLVGLGVGLLRRLQRLFLRLGRSLQDFPLLLGVFLRQFLLFPGLFCGIALILHHAHLLSVQRHRARSSKSHEQSESKKAFHHKILRGIKIQVYTKRKDQVVSTLVSGLDQSRYG